MSAAQRPAVYLVDASMYVFRAWHSMPDAWHDAEGWPLNAVHGYTRFLCELHEREKPTHIVVAFDEALDNCYRNEIYPQYKANRPPAPEELRRQFAVCKAVTAALGWNVASHSEFEADDLIGAAMVLARENGYRGVIVSADKDLSQLLQDDDEQFDFARNTRWTQAGVKAKHGVHAHQIADYLALCGDAVDNIPGIQGIGQKTAAHLISHFETLDALLDRVDEVAHLRLRGAHGIALKLKAQQADARLFQRLTRIATHAPLPRLTSPFARGQADAAHISELCDTLKFGPLTRRRLMAVAGISV
jgi:5'-3' exonuclease